MKKFFSIIAFSFLFTGVIFSQDDANEKNFRFGLRASPQVNWLRTNNPKLYESSGAKFGFGFGLDLEIRLSRVANFLTGIGGDLVGGRQTYKATDGYGYSVNKANELIKNDDDNWSNTASGNSFLINLKSRKVNTTYITIPFALKLMTKEFSGLKYYGIFGGEIGVLTKAVAEDDIEQIESITGNEIKYKPVTQNSDLNIMSDCIPVKASWKIGAGAEYNLSGTTNLFVGINYVRCFTNLYRSESKYVVGDFASTVINNVTPRVKAKQGAFGDAIVLNIGILF